MLNTITALVAALALSTVSVDARSCFRGLGWATNNNYAGHIGNKPLICWYYHWQDPVVPQMPDNVPYIPQYWGKSMKSNWLDRVKSFSSKLPGTILGFNEPDISSQGNMSPSSAASEWMKEIHPWGKKGVQLVSPAIAYSIDWLTEFISDIEKQGGYVDAVCAHWYGPASGLGTFKTYLEQVHKATGKTVWVTELGITAASNPSQASVKKFMMNAMHWMEGQSWIGQVAWFGVWENTQPPDGYSTAHNALLNSGGGLSDMGYAYVYTSSAYPKRDEGEPKVARRSHHQLSRSVDGGANTTAIDCDEICELRNQQLAKWAALPIHPDSVLQ